MDVYTRVVSTLRKEFPRETALSGDRDDPFHSLIATVLSHKTRDDKTTIAADALLSAYPTPAKLAAAPVFRIEALIRPVGFYHQKSPRVKEIARQLIERFGGEVPRTFAELTSLPGVGRKTAGCVLVYAFGEPAIPVDVHVAVISKRLGWAKRDNPDKIEQELYKVVPRGLWLDVNDLFVRFGQEVCLTARPKCWRCPVFDDCAYPERARIAREHQG